MLSNMHNSSELAEYIGAESCFIPEADVSDNIIIPPRAATKKNQRRTRVAAAASEKAYPPPMKRSPTVMWKHSMSDDRVVLEEAKVKRHRCMRAHRSGERFLLNLKVEVFDDCPEKMDGGDDDGVDGDADPTAEEEDGEVGSCNDNICDDSGVDNPTYGGFAPVAAVGPPVLN